MRHWLVYALGSVTLACGADSAHPDTQSCGITAVAGAPASSCGGATGFAGATSFAGALNTGASNVGATPTSGGASHTGGAPPGAGGAVPAMGTVGVPGMGGASITPTGMGGVGNTGGTPMTGSPGGSPGAGAAGAAASVPFSSISMMLASTCGGTNCHTTREKPMLVNNPNLHMTLLDTVVSECGGAHLVVPGNPDGSAIIQLINRRCTKSGKPFYMPRTCTTNPCLPAAQIQTITTWIQAGAPAQ